MLILEGGVLIPALAGKGGVEQSSTPKLSDRIATTVHGSSSEVVAGCLRHIFLKLAKTLFQIRRNISNFFLPFALSWALYCSGYMRAVGSASGCEDET